MCIKRYSLGIIYLVSHVLVYVFVIKHYLLILLMNRACFLCI